MYPGGIKMALGPLRLEECRTRLMAQPSDRPKLPIPIQDWDVGAEIV